MSTIVSAPGKIHLLGEHVVVYGKPALLTAINRRLYVEIKESNSSGLIIKTTEDEHLVRKTIAVFQKAFKLSVLPPLEIIISSAILTGCGLGSSSALASALIGALIKHLKNIWNPNRINEFTYEVEKIAHGNPSGADNTAVVFGGLVWFRREFEFLKSIWSLPVSSYKIPSFVLIDSGRPVETTREMVESVANFARAKKVLFSKILDDQEDQTKKLLLSLKEGNLDQMKNAFLAGQRNLEKIGVVGKKAKMIIAKVEKIGGVAKVCGAGGYKKGSGIILAYHQNLSKMEKLAKTLGLDLTQIIPGGEGIRIEKNQN